MSTVLNHNIYYESVSQFQGSHTIVKMFFCQKLLGEVKISNLVHPLGYHKHYAGEKPLQLWSIIVTHWHILCTEMLHLNWVSNYIALNWLTLAKKRVMENKTYGDSALGIYRVLGQKYF